LLIAVNYHYLRPSFDTPYPGIHGLTPGQFEAQLKALSRAGEFVSGEQVRDAVRGLSPLPERSLLITFDDGLREQYEHGFPVLQRLGIPALFFINTGPIQSGRVSSVHKIHLLRASAAPGEFLLMLRRHAENLGIALDLGGESDRAAAQYQYDPPETARLKYLLNFLLSPFERDRLIEACFQEAFAGREAEISRALYMDLEQIRELGRCRYVGSHGHEHLPMGLLPIAAAEEQVRLSLVHLEEWAGYRPFCLSYPYGSREAASAEVGRVAARLGVTVAFTIEQAGNVHFRQPLHLARFDCNDVPGGKASRFPAEALFEQVPPASWFGG
jgi:peptidoglycan/xylan/chitin deacetylase (PgdA/CDA1 family)